MYEYIKGVVTNVESSYIVLENNDMKACNSASGEAVIPITVSRSKVDGGIMTSVLNKASWNVIRLKKQK